MSDERVKTLLDEAIQKITANLAALNSTADAAAIEAAIDGPVKKAFQELSKQAKADEKEADTKKLYKKFSLKLHPDKLSNNTEAYAVKLLALSSTNAAFLRIPQQVIEKYKTGALTDAFENMNASDPASVQKVVVELLKALEQFINEYQRYDESVRSIVGYARGTIIAGLAIGTGVGVVSGIILAGLVQWANRTLLNLMTGYHYDDELDKGVTRENMAKKVRDGLRDSMPDVDDKSDDDVIELYLVSVTQVFEQIGISLSREQAEQVLKNSVKYSIFGFAHLAVVLDAFNAAIFKPLPGGIAENTAAILLRSAQALLLVPALMMDATNQLLQEISNVLILLSLAVALVSCAAIVLLTNMPLYIYDGYMAATVYVASAYESMFAGVDPAAAPAPETPKSSWYSGFNFFGGAGASSAKQAEPANLSSPRMPYAG